jgi:hypothetical protein
VAAGLFSCDNFVNLKPTHLQSTLMKNDVEKYNLLLASYLEPECIEKIRQVAPDRLNVVFEPGLIGQP